MGDKITGKDIREGFGFFMAPNGTYDKQHDIIDTRTGEIRKMNAYEIVVLGYLLRCTNNGGRAFPSYSKISKCCGMSVRTAVRTISNLTESGYIVKRNRGYNKETEGQVKRYSNVYEIMWEKLV